QYSFCLAHAMAVTRVAWNQALLRVRCRAAFGLAVLTHRDGRFAPWVHVECAKRDGVCICPPCVNRSAASGWSQEVAALRPGLSCVRGLAKGTAVAVVAEREGNGPFAGHDDAKRVVGVPPSDLEALSSAGAFDFAGQARRPFRGGSWPGEAAAPGPAEREAEWAA